MYSFIGKIPAVHKVQMHFFSCLAQPVLFHQTGIQNETLVWPLCFSFWRIILHVKNIVHIIFSKDRKKQEQYAIFILWEHFPLHLPWKTGMGIAVVVSLWSCPCHVLVFLCSYNVFSSIAWWGAKALDHECLSNATKLAPGDGSQQRSIWWDKFAGKKWFWIRGVLFAFTIYNRWDY